KRLEGFKLLLLGLFRFVKFQRRGVDAVTKMGRLWAVVEHMTEMGAALTAHRFGAPHQKTVVIFGLDVLLRYRLPKAWPAGAGIEFGVGAKELVAATSAAIHPLLVVIPIFAGKRAFGALLTANLNMFVGEFLLPFFIGLFDLFHDSFLHR